jgi:hypothetical protein
MSRRLRRAQDAGQRPERRRRGAAGNSPEANFRPRAGTLPRILFEPALALGRLAGTHSRLALLSVCAPSPALGFSDPGTTGLRFRARRQSAMEAAAPLAPMASLAPTDQPQLTTDRLSIVVLPFTNLSGDSIRTGKCHFEGRLLKSCCA